MKYLVALLLLRLDGNGRDVRYPKLHAGRDAGWGNVPHTRGLDP